MFYKVTERKGAHTKSEAFASAEVQGMYRMPWTSAETKAGPLPLHSSSPSTILLLPWPTIAGPLSLHYIGLSPFTLYYIRRLPPLVYFSFGFLSISFYLGSSVYY